ncbi:MAG: hypothetical protein K2Y42_20915, partial [Hyphomicrobium sp.]|nr:hypothetical protein [Hyphomicrobium sp.]
RARVIFLKVRDRRDQPGFACVTRHGEQDPAALARRSRSPFIARPQRRAMLVEAQVSSMKIRRAGSRSS